MKLDDFEKIEHGIANCHDHDTEVKAYIISKLREFGEGLRREPVSKWNEGVPDDVIAEDFAEGYNTRNSELNAQIDKELKELE